MRFAIRRALLSATAIVAEDRQCKPGKGTQRSTRRTRGDWGPGPSPVSGRSIVANAVPLNLPRTVSKSVIMTRARVGAPFISQNISLLFGAVVPPPDTDEYGVLLSQINTNLSPNRPIVEADDYWFPEPASLTGHTNSGYYWSPHAQAVFAINPGPLQIVWRRALPGPNLPSSEGRRLGQECRFRWPPER